MTPRAARCAVAVRSDRPRLAPTPLYATDRIRRMDEIVSRAMAKWPNVPAVYGWLALDARGQWLIKGERIGNPGIVEFIGRNYDRDAQGRWFFQNGPQRVFVDLFYTPYVFRFDPEQGTVLVAQNAIPATRVDGCWIDEHGRVIVATEIGIGTIHDRDVEHFARLFCDHRNGAPDEDTLLATIEAFQVGRAAALFLGWQGQRIPVEPIRSDAVFERFGIVARPQPAAGEEACT